MTHPFGIDLDIQVLDDRMLDPGIGLPSPATEGAAACDLRAWALFDTKPDGRVDMASRRPFEEPVRLERDRLRYVGCGFAMASRSPGFVALLHPRSGLGTQGLVLGNLTGVIDLADYRGEIVLALWNRRNESDDDAGPAAREFTVEPGDRVCQMLVTPALRPVWNRVAELPPSVRGTGGFGSTGR